MLFTLSTLSHPFFLSYTILHFPSHESSPGSGVGSSWFRRWCSYLRQTCKDLVPHWWTWKLNIHLWRFCLNAKELCQSHSLHSSFKKFIFKFLWDQSLLFLNKQPFRRISFFSIECTMPFWINTLWIQINMFLQELTLYLSIDFYSYLFSCSYFFPLLRTFVFFFFHLSVWAREGMHSFYLF